MVKTLKVLRDTMQRYCAEEGCFAPSQDANDTHSSSYSSSCFFFFGGNGDASDFNKQCRG
ncbi:MAG: hypothetical protein M3162_06985 [Thermoproteota archaeon]|nr:hypothetical protein [Thermoproteota archaeon]